MPSCPGLSRASTFFVPRGKAWMAGTSPATTMWRQSVLRLVHLGLDQALHVVGCGSVGETALVGDVCHRNGDAGRDLANARECRIEAALREVLLADAIGERMGGRHEHLVRHQART